jgi:leucyl aminopeptidase
MKMSVATGDIAQHEGPAVVVNLFEGVTAPGGATGAVDDALGGAVSRLIQQGEVKGKRGEVTVIHTLGKLPAERAVIVGLGKQDEFTLDVVRTVSAQVCRHLRKIGVSTAATIAHGAGFGGLEAAACASAIAEGSLMGLYRFDKYKSSQSDRNDLDELTLVELDRSRVGAMEKALEDGLELANAVNLCRDMVNEPANIMTPTRMSEVALEVAREGEIEIQVFERSDMEEMGMGALVGVAQGSPEPPKLIVLKYTGNPDNPSDTVGLLGKGITFDSGGLDLKPAAGMRTMKGDMAGGASVIAAMKVITKVRPKINVTAIVAATENMPGGRAQRPGDIVRTMNGKTIEIDNTDAEGRLVLADAVAYARSVGIGRIADVATLTGAMITALGNQCTGVFGNDQDLVDSVISAGAEAGERMWQLPLLNEYKSQYRSDVADIKNTGGRAAGSITAAQIIGEFADGAAWVHLDIAGTSTADSTKGYRPKGSTGVPVRTLVALVRALSETRE